MTRKSRAILAVGLLLILVAAVAVVVRPLWGVANRTHMVAYFDNSNGIFVGDEVRILGVPVGEIDRIEPQPQRAKISFWINGTYKVPADAKAVILAPRLVTARAIQLTPVYTSGPAMSDGAVIPQNRTAVPVEWDELRDQLEKLTKALQPTQPGGVSTLGAFVNTAAANLRGQGAKIRETVIKISQAFAILGDHSNDIFSTVKNLNALVSALQSSSDLLAQLNVNLAAVTATLANDPDEVGRAVQNLNTAARDVTDFVADNREAIGTTSDKLASVSQTLVDSLGDIKELLHTAPNTIQNLNNIYQPAQGTLSGALAINNFANPIQFLCSAVEAASRENGEQSAKLCAQYLAPILKNRQYNFPPIGENLFDGTTARPNEVTYSEDWMRPDYVPPRPAPAPEAAPPVGPLPAEVPLPNGQESLPAPAPTAVPTDPAAGLPGLMLPPGGGS